jgi:hypothetical protein
LSYKEKGQLIKTTGVMILALHKGIDGWRIAAWAGLVKECTPEYTATANQTL